MAALGFYEKYRSFSGAGAENRLTFLTVYVKLESEPLGTGFYKRADFAPPDIRRDWSEEVKDFVRYHRKREQTV